MANFPKSQHTVPIFYLKAWSDHNKIWTYDKQRNKIYKPHITEVCINNNFYKHFENKISKIESVLSKAYKEVEGFKPSTLYGYYKSKMIEGLILQRFRTPQFLERLKDKESFLKSGIITSLEKMHQTDLYKILYSNYNINLIKVECFVTSDNPVIVCSNGDVLEPQRTNGDLGMPNTQVLYPISPNSVIQCVEKKHDYNNVIRNNELQIYNAKRFIFAHSEELIKEVKIFCERAGLKRKELIKSCVY